MGWFSIDRYRNPYVRQVAEWFDRRTGEPPRASALAASPAASRADRVSRVRAIEVRPIGAAAADEWAWPELSSQDAPRAQGAPREAPEARLTRRLASMRPVDDRRAIDLHFVTCAEYQLFLDAMRARNEVAPPDHWASPHFAPGQADAPALGVRAEDARRFARWMSRRHGNGMIYRLPTPEEARAFPAEDEAAGATWCEAGERLVLTGLSPEVERDFQQRLGAISPLPPPRTLAFDIVRIFDLARDRDLDVDLALIIALALGHDLVSSLEPGPASAAERRLGLDLAIALGASICRVLGRASTAEITLALANARARARDLDFDRDQTLAIALRPVLEIARNGSRRRPGRAAGTGGADPAHRADALRAERDNEIQLIEQASAIVEARAPAGDRIGARRAIFELSGWLRLIAARKDDRMPAWEGIRLVRQRPFVEPRARARIGAGPGRRAARSIAGAIAT